MIRQFAPVVLLRNIEPGDSRAVIMEMPGLRTGVVGIAVDTYPDRDAYDVEFLESEGSVVALVLLQSGDIVALESGRSRATLHREKDDSTRTRGEVAGIGGRPVKWADALTAGRLPAIIKRDVCSRPVTSL